jgi:hypothetical protein
MSRDNLRAIREFQHAAIRGEVVRQMPEQATPEVVEIFEIRFADLAQQQALQTRHALTIVDSQLREQPMRLATTSRTAVAHRRRPVALVTKPRRRTGRKLARLEDDARAREVPHLILGAARPACGGEILLNLRGLRRLV